MAPVCARSWLRRKTQGLRQSGLGEPCLPAGNSLGDKVMKKNQVKGRIRETRGEVDTCRSRPRLAAPRPPRGAAACGYSHHAGNEAARERERHANLLVDCRYQPGARSCERLRSSSLRSVIRRTTSRCRSRSAGDQRDFFMSLRCLRCETACPTPIVNGESACSARLQPQMRSRRT